MKKIIDSKRYDTDTAHYVAEWDNEYPANDLKYASEALYRKRTGEYFLYGEGGAMSKYATSHGNGNWGGGEAIVPLTYDAARQWAEEHLDADDYEAEFGRVPEDSTTVSLGVYVPADVKAALDQYARANGIGQSVAVARAIRRLVGASV